MPAQQQSPTAEFLADALASSGKSLKQVAQEIGLAPLKMLGMMANGSRRVPLEYIAALARACDVSEGVFLFVALREYHPELLVVLGATYDFLSPNEKEWLDIYRALTRRRGLEYQMDTNAWLDIYWYAEKALKAPRTVKE